MLKEATDNDTFFNTGFKVDAETFQHELGSIVLELTDGVTAYVTTFTYKKNVFEETDNKGKKKITIKGVLKDKRINVTKKQRADNEG